jgi:hypothetical protein
MVKGNTKSSATSGTRKKHAKRAAGPVHVAEEPGPIPKEKKPTKKERTQKKNAKEPRVKVYIPPVKPAPLQLDPLETTGLVHKLPPELLIVLRNLSKKAQVTKVRALEELQAGWVERCKREGEGGEVVYVLVDMLPVWVRCFCVFDVCFINVVLCSYIMSQHSLCTIRDEYGSSQQTYMPHCSRSQQYGIRYSFPSATQYLLRSLKASSGHGAWPHTTSIAP